MYKHPRAYKTLRGLDVKGIGEQHELADCPMMTGGSVKILEVQEIRLKVSGSARAGAGDATGTTYHLSGCIDKPGVA